MVVAQSKEYRRPNGMRIKFQENAVVILKDEKRKSERNNIQRSIAKEATERWPGVAKLASIII